MDSTFALQHEPPLCVKKQGFSVHFVDSSGIRSAPVAQENFSISCCTLSRHQEFLCLDFTTSSLFFVIFGMLWMMAHNPCIDWSTREVTFISSYCPHPSRPPLSYVFIQVQKNPNLILQFISLTKEILAFGQIYFPLSDPELEANISVIIPNQPCVDY